MLSERVSAILESLLSSLTHCGLFTTPVTVNGAEVSGTVTLIV